MRVDLLLLGISYQLQQGSLDCEVTGLCEDSRKIKKGDLFYCRTGIHTSGKNYLRQALIEGAAAVVCDVYGEEEKRILSSNRTVCVIVAPIVEATQARLASNFYQFPQEKLLLIGVTGTKGKTTVCAMLQKLFCDNQIACAAVGTTGFSLNGKVKKSSHTTPEVFELYGYLAEAVDAGCTHFLIEVSSLAVKQGRIAGLTFELGIFTNLSMDHVGENEHSSFLEYAYWKKQFFTNCKRVLLNRDDSFSFEIAQERAVCSWYSTTVRADGYASDVSQSIREDGFYQCFLWHWQSENERRVGLKMPGRCNVQNATAALSAFCLLTPSRKHADDRMDFENFAVCGRFEFVGHFHGGWIVIDYAHNEESLKTLLEAVRAFHPARILCLFGCGGNRSRVRRHAMGRVSSELADLTVITEDNSRSEPFETILSDIWSGVTRPQSCTVIRDRKEAILYCMEQMRPGDILLLAGKGHEDTQEFSGRVEAFSERAIVENYCDKAILKNRKVR